MSQKNNVWNVSQTMAVGAYNPRGLNSLRKKQDQRISTSPIPDVNGWSICLWWSNQKIEIRVVDDAPDTQYVVMTLDEEDFKFQENRGLSISSRAMWKINEKSSLQILRWDEYDHEEFWEELWHEARGSFDMMKVLDA
jgi:hypothetical protein